MAAVTAAAAGLAATLALLGIPGLGGGGDPPPGFARHFAREAAPYPVPAAGSYALPPLRTAPDGAVLDDRGRPQRLADLLAGQVTLVSFVYLMCGDGEGCPLATATLFDIWNASEAVPQLKGKVQLMTISFDPGRDTPEALASFSWPIRNDPARDRKIDWQVLTTAGQPEIRPLLTGFGQTVDPAADSDRLNHLLRLFLVDRQGRVRNVYGLGMLDPQLMMTDVETLLREAP